MAKTIRLSGSSRYIGTDLLQLVDGSGYLTDSYAFGVWNPVTIEPRADDIIHFVSQHEIGRIDLIAHKYYKDSRLWWIIALVNDIKDPWDDLTMGKTLRIPTEATVRGAIQANRSA